MTEARPVSDGLALILLGPPGAGKGRCDRCGGQSFMRRADDTAATARTRLEAYHTETAPLIGYYARRGVLAHIDAMAPIDAVSKRISAIVAGLRSRVAGKQPHRAEAPDG